MKWWILSNSWIVCTRGSDSLLVFVLDDMSGDADVDVDAVCMVVDCLRLLMF